MTDAITPEFRLTPEAPGTVRLSEWDMDDANALMFHQPTRALFSIYLTPGTNPAAPKIHQLRARLTHVCDGFPIPSDFPALGPAAINGLAILSERLHVVEFCNESDDIPFLLPPRLLMMRHEAAEVFS